MHGDGRGTDRLPLLRPLGEQPRVQARRCRDSCPVLLRVVFVLTLCFWIGLAAVGAALVITSGVANDRHHAERETCTVLVAFAAVASAITCLQAIGCARMHATGPTELVRRALRVAMQTMQAGTNASMRGPLSRPIVGTSGRLVAASTLLVFVASSISAVVAVAVARAKRPTNLLFFCAGAATIFSITLAGVQNDVLSRQVVLDIEGWNDIERALALWTNRAQALGPAVDAFSALLDFASTPAPAGVGRSRSTACLLTRAIPMAVHGPCVGYVLLRRSR